MKLNHLARLRNRALFCASDNEALVDTLIEYAQQLQASPRIAASVPPILPRLSRDWLVIAPSPDQRAAHPTLITHDCGSALDMAIG